MNGRPSRELQEALDNLNIVAESKGVLAASIDLEVKAGKIVCSCHGAFRKTIELVRAYLATAFSPLAEGFKDDLVNAIVKSSEVVKRNAILLHLWADGTDEQRRFAAYAKGAIERFNRFVEEADQPSHVGRRFFTFRPKAAKRLKKIDVIPVAPLNVCLSPMSSTQYDPLKMLNKVAVKAPETMSKKVQSLRESFLPVQAEGLFLMKAISLLEKEGLASHNEARLMVRNGTVQTRCDAQTGIHLMSVRLQPYPGRTIDIQGSFMGRIPLSDTFQINLYHDEKP